MGDSVRRGNGKGWTYSSPHPHPRPTSEEKGRDEKEVLPQSLNPNPNHTSQLVPKRCSGLPPKPNPPSGKEKGNQPTLLHSHPCGETGESLPPPLLSPSHTPKESVKRSRRKRRRKYPYSFQGGRKGKSKVNGIGNETQALPKHGGVETSPGPRLSLPLTRRGRGRKSKEERIEEAVLASVAICGATPEVILRQRRACREKEKAPFPIPIIPTPAKSLQGKVVKGQKKKSLSPSSTRRETRAGTGRGKETESRKGRTRNSNPESLTSIHSMTPFQEVKVIVKKEPCGPKTRPLPPPTPPHSSQVDGREDRSVPTSSHPTPALHNGEKEGNDRVGRMKRRRARSLDTTPSPSLKTEPSSSSSVSLSCGGTEGRSRTQDHQAMSSSTSISSSSTLPTTSDNWREESESISRKRRKVERSFSLNGLTPHPHPHSHLNLSPLECLEKETKKTLEKLLTAVVSSVEKERLEDSYPTHVPGTN